jgi:hypothetical protein
LTVNGSPSAEKKRKDRFIRGGLARTGYQNRVMKSWKKVLICDEGHRLWEDALKDSDELLRDKNVRQLYAILSVGANGRSPERAMIKEQERQFHRSYTQMLCRDPEQETPNKNILGQASRG